MVLIKEDFYIDPLEETGGGIYMTSFFGPSTKSALRDFKQKYKLPLPNLPNNLVLIDTETTKQLNILYGCKEVVNTSTTTNATK